MSQYKTCTKCNQTKSLDAFGKNKDYKDGFRFDCKVCVSAYNKAWRNANPEYGKEWQRANLKKFAAYSRKWREGNPEKSNASAKRYREANSEKLLDQAKAYYHANPEKMSQESHQRRAVLRKATVYKVTLKEIARFYASPCAYCGAPSKHLDHVIPFSRGGTHGIGNLTGACANCNLSKGIKFITEWKKGK